MWMYVDVTFAVLMWSHLHSEYARGQARKPEGATQQL